MPDRKDEIAAAGGLLWRRGPAGLEVALVHRPRYDDWSLPKGKLDRGEPALLGALREVQEETGYDGVAGRCLGSSRYPVLLDGVVHPKRVDWWAVRCTSGSFVPGAEVDALQWLPLDDAAGLLTAGRDRDVLDAWRSGPADPALVLLVRHGSAGDRRGWDGPDVERPLDETGRQQAAALQRLLTCYQPVRVLSAPPLRCLQTVQPLAEALGLPVEHEPVLAEDAADDVGARVAAVRALARRGEAVVLCSQGGVVPDVVSALADQAGLEIGKVGARKGSTWVLAFDADGRLLAADHAPAP